MGCARWTNQAHQSIVLVVLLAILPMVLAMGLLAHSVVVRHAHSEFESQVDIKYEGMDARFVESSGGDVMRIVYRR